MEDKDLVRQRQIEPSRHPNDLYEDPEYVWKRKWKDEYDTYRQQGNDHAPERSFLPGLPKFRIQLFISCCLAALVWTLFQYDHPAVNQLKAQVAAALNKSFDFQAVAMWYERQWGGNPSLLPAWIPGMQPEAQKVNAHNKNYYSPVQGTVIAPFEANRLGVTLETKMDAVVSALDTGLVIYKGNKDDTGYTIIIRHADGMQSVYGWLQQANVELNDWIKGGEQIGTVSRHSSNRAGYLYFAISKANRFLNPTDVVTFE